MQTSAYHGIKVTKTHPISTVDSLVIEAPLQININGESFTVVMRTPGSDEDLVRGLLYAEDIYKKNASLELKLIESNEDGSAIVNCEINKRDLGKGYLNKRSLLSISSCGICGKQDLYGIQHKDGKALKSNIFKLEAIRNMYCDLGEQQELFHISGGSHAAGIFDTNYELISIREDIGRHNAVDKCVGDLLQKNQLNKGKILLVSGRVSYEIISKAFLAKIPLVAAVSACSSLAVDFAKEFGICLVGFARDDKMTIYSNPNYLIQS